MHWRCLARIDVLVFLCFLACLPLLPARAQSTSTAPGFKEIEIAASAFSAAVPLPSRVDHIEIPSADSNEAIVIRLADTQILAGSAPVCVARLR